MTGLNTENSTVFYVTEGVIDEDLRFNAGSKARDDLDLIFQRSSLQPLSLRLLGSSDGVYKGSVEATYKKRISNNLRMGREWVRLFSSVKSGIVFIQYPLNVPSALLPIIMRRSKRRGLKVVLFVHDIFMARFSKTGARNFAERLRNYQKERSLLRMADIVIAHNDRMAEVLIRDFDIKPAHIVELGLFDYLVGSFHSHKGRSRESPIVIAGNLAPDKAGYLSQLPSSVNFNLYGSGYNGGGPENVHYMGVYTPDELPHNLEGSFGLVWDGPDPSSCSGMYGSYLRINNPHKTSLYLASGLPVVVWSGAAVSEFITANGLGIAVDSLYDLSSRLALISDDQYDEMLKRVSRIGHELRSGRMTIDAIQASIRRIHCLSDRQA